jgi:hypothetical protein
MREEGKISVHDWESVTNLLDDTVKASYHVHLNVEAASWISKDNNLHE